MYKTVWYIYDGEEKTELTWYHFGKQPQFPSWYMEEGKAYEIEMIWHFKLIPTFSALRKCLFHEYIIR